MRQINARRKESDIKSAYLEIGSAISRSMAFFCQDISELRIKDTGLQMTRKAEEKDIMTQMALH